MTNQLLVVDTPQEISMFQLLALKGALRLELAGMTRRGRSAFGIVREQFGLRGSRQAVFTQFCEFVEKVKAGDAAYLSPVYREGRHG